MLRRWLNTLAGIIVAAINVTTNPTIISQKTINTLANADKMMWKIKLIIEPHERLMHSLLK